MLSLDEAILHAEEVAEEYEKQVIWLRSKEGNPNCEHYVDRAKEHRQLAEWLKELKAYRDGCHCDTCKYLDKNSKNRPCGWCGDNESNWEYGGKC
jgi:hypothetical protein